jgi:hypothetical protein
MCLSAVRRAMRFHIERRTAVPAEDVGQLAFGSCDELNEGAHSYLRAVSDGDHGATLLAGMGAN